MFTQLFGGYLFNQHILNADQLAHTMEAARNTRVKLGVLAINAGYLTAQQVDECHSLQARKDKRMGDIAVELGYITDAQVEELLRSQKSGYLALGQAIVDAGYMNNAQLEEALNSYKASAAITDSDLAQENDGKSGEVLRSYYQISTEDDFDGMTDYIVLLFKNLVRFIGDDFSMLAPEKTEETPGAMTARQDIEGPIRYGTAICADESVMIQFASRYAKESFTENDEYVSASVGEFLNLHNGLFTVNMSGQRSIELELMPQTVEAGGYPNAGNGYIIPVQYPFGVIRFTIVSKEED